MPVTKQQIQQNTDKMFENVEKYNNWNEWFWDGFCSNPETYIVVDDTGNVMYGRQEVSQWYDARAKAGHLKMGIDKNTIYMNAFGPGIHVSEFVITLTREKPLAPGMPVTTRHQSINILDDNGKMMRQITSPADQETEDAMKQLIKAQDAAKGVPEGGFPEVLELYKKFEKMVPDYDAVCKAMADDCVFIDPTGLVMIGHQQFVERSKAWYDIGFKSWKSVGTIRTPSKDTVIAKVEHDFSGLPDGAVPEKNPPGTPPICYKFDLETGKVKRAAILINTFKGTEWNRNLAAWLGKQQTQTQEAA